MATLKQLAACLAMLCILTGCTSCGGGQSTVPTPPPPTRPNFDRSLAYSDIVTQCNFGPRNPGSTGHENCRAWLVNKLTALADSVVKQDFSARTPLGGPYSFQNILGVFASQATGSPLLLAAHWDTRPIADEDPDAANRNTAILGANDGASGVAVLLEVARHLKDNPPTRPVIIAFLDAEDSGLASSAQPYMGFCIGSNYLANNWPGGLPIPAEMILLDMVGADQRNNPRLQPTGAIDGPEFRLEQNSLNSNPSLMNRIWSAAESRGHTAFVRQPQGAITDDHKPFIDKGLPAVDIIHFAPAEWHTVDDTPAHCSAETLYQVGDTLVSILWP